MSAWIHIFTSADRQDCRAHPAIKGLFMRQHGSQAEGYKGQKGQLKCNDY